MQRRGNVGTETFLTAAFAAAVMMTLTFFIAPKARMSGDMGVCLPSPNTWHITPLLSWGLNTGVVALLVLGAHLLNRQYNFIKSPSPVLPAVFLILTASNPWVTSYLSASGIVCALAMMSLSILFGCYRSRNAAQEMFVIGTFISLGSMIQYAVLPFLVPLVLAAIVMKAFRIKECLAIGMGMIAPYWVGVGMGIIPVGWFRLPEMSNLFNGLADRGDIFVLVVSVGLALFFGLILGLNNSFRLYAGNSRVNVMNLSISLVGITAAICMVVDFNNMTTYLDTIYFAVAVQAANMSALWHIRREWLVVAIPGVIYAGFYIVMLLG